MKPVILRPSPWKWLGVGAISLAFVLAALLVIEDTWVRWTSGLFFGLTLLVSLVQFLPNVSFLRLDEEGLTARSLFRTFSLRWDEVAGFYPVKIGHNAFVGYELRAPEGAWGEFNRAVAGTPRMLPDTYGLGAAKLADLLEAHRMRARAKSR